MNPPHLFLNIDNLEDLPLVQKKKEEFFQLIQLTSYVFIDTPSSLLFRWLYKNEVGINFLEHYKFQSRFINANIYDLSELKKTILHRLSSFCEKMVLDCREQIEKPPLNRRAYLYLSLGWLLDFIDKLHSENPDFIIKENIEELIHRVEKVLNTLSNVQESTIS